MSSRLLSGALASLLASCGSSAAPSPAEPSATTTPSASTAEPSVAEQVFDGPRSGCALHVRSELPPDETGTMHYADRVVLSVGPGVPVELVTDLEAGTLAPFVTRAIDLGGAFLVLGHASWGSGTQTLTALVVEGARCGGLSVASRLDVTSSRGGAGLLVDAASTSVGIPTSLVDDPELAVSLDDRAVDVATLGGATRRASAEWVGAAVEREAAGEVDAVWLAASVEGLEAARLR